MHTKWLEIQREMYGGQSREIPRLSDTRWACRYVACHNLLGRLPAVVRVLQEIGLRGRVMRIGQLMLVVYLAKLT